MKIVLLGYMGSGKTTIGKMLSSVLYFPFIDLDHFIQTEEKMTIPEIFSTKGEIYFRKIEHQYLQQLLEKEESFILSVGGGTPCYAGNMDLIKESGATSIYLQLNIPNLVKRLLNCKTKRPLIAEISNDDLPEYIAKHLFERRNFYELADIRINSNEKSKEEVLNEIRMKLY